MRYSLPGSIAPASRLSINTARAVVSPSSKRNSSSCATSCAVPVIVPTSMVISSPKLDSTALMRIEHDDAVGCGLGIQGFDERRATREHCALIDIALIGDLAGIDRRGLLQQQSACRVSRASACAFAEAAESCAHVCEHRGMR